MAQEKKVEAETDSASDQKRLRSPAFPFIPLRKALARAEKFYEEEKRSAAPLVAAARHWDFGSPKTSSALQTFAAMKYFGIMEDAGSGKSRKIKLTELGLRILLDERPNSPEKLQAIQAAALKPKMHSELWEKWRTDLPSDATLKHYLVFDREGGRFNEDSAGKFIAEYKDTIAFAKLAESDSLPMGESDTGQQSDDILKGFGMKDDATPEMKSNLQPASMKPPLVDGTPQDELQYRLSKDGVALVYRGRVTKQIMQKLISYLKIDLETMPEPDTTES